MPAFEKRSVMKKTLIIVVIAAVIIAAGFFIFYSNLNSIVAKLIEKNGSEVTQTSVTVAGVDLKLRDGRASIDGLKIASPDGFKADNVFSLEDITVDIAVGSIRKDPIVIEEIRIKAPEVYAEVNKEGSSNIDELRKRIKEYGSGGTGERSGSQGEEKRIRIKNFVFEKGSIHLDATELGLEKRTIDLPEIRLQDVGGPEGAPAGDIAKIILSTFAARTASGIAESAAGDMIKKKLGGSIKDKAKGLLDKIKN